MKNKLRKKYLDIRKNIQEKDEKSLNIFSKIILENKFINAKVIALYKALPSEVNTDNLISYALGLGKTVCLHKVEGDNLVFYRIKSLNDKFLKSDFGVEEPINSSNNLVSNFDINLVIVPGVAFDSNKNRIGFGKGYYDKFLNNFDVYTIGICFDEQIVEEGIYADLHDIKMNKVITDKREIK